MIVDGKIGENFSPDEKLPAIFQSVKKMVHRFTYFESQTCFQMIQHPTQLFSSETQPQSPYNTHTQHSIT